MLSIKQRQPTQVDFLYLCLSPSELSFVKPFQDYLLDENDPAVLISHAFTQEQAEKYSESLSREFPNVRNRVFPSQENLIDYYVCIERHSIPGVSQLSERVKAASKPLMVSILEHNSRSVENNIEAKLKNEFEDAQLHVDVGFQPDWEKFDAFIAKKKAIKKPFGYGEQEVSELNAGVAWAQGENDQMEDAQLVSSIKLIQGDKEINIPIYAIFDGHGNFSCAAYLKKNLESYLHDKFREIFTACPCPGPERTANIFNLLKKTFVELGRRFNDAFSDDNRYLSGSTATIALIVDGHLWVANVGDSRAILCREGKAIALSQDAKPGLEKYCRGIEKRGRYVGFANGCLRTIGKRMNMGVARAVGHDEITSGINPRAELIRYPLSEIDKNCMLVIASDGLWDVVSSNQVAETVINNSDCLGVASHLVKRAYHTGSADNISAIVVQFD